jgi:hypothetical protein
MIYEYFDIHVHNMQQKLLKVTLCSFILLSRPAELVMYFKKIVYQNGHWPIIDIEKNVCNKM